MGQAVSNVGEEGVVALVVGGGSKYRYHHPLLQSLIFKKYEKRHILMPHLPQKTLTAIIYQPDRIGKEDCHTSQVIPGK